MKTKFDVAILGAGLAGLSLTRQLTLMSGQSILLLEKRPQIPPPRQKVGEATVQLSGYYFAKVLDLEEHLLRKQLMKYNLRFYWKTLGRANDAYEDYSQSYIRHLSNIASYQLDRNKIEGELLKLNRQSPNVTFFSGVSETEVSLKSDGPHELRFKLGETVFEAQAGWVIDTTGRSKFLSRRLGLTRANPIHHGASFFWVEGLLNIEKLTDLSLTEARTSKHRCMTGHLPVWLATNHFVGEGFWFWVIPLHGKTSLGLVYDRDKIREDQVNTPEKLIAWVGREFPLFARELKNRKILDQGMYRDFSYDCRQTISDSRWAMSGEAGRFTDPLYSPGGDLISLYNTLIADCILTKEAQLLRSKVRLYEVLMQAAYQAYVPSYSVSYEVLGDQECFALKYAWELAVYFVFFVFPFINDLFTDLRFLPSYLRLLAEMGALNSKVQDFVTSYYRWKKKLARRESDPRFFDFTELGPLRDAERLFYEVGIGPDAAVELLTRAKDRLRELARYVAAHVSSAVSGNVRWLTDGTLIEALDLEAMPFDPERMHRQALDGQAADARYDWGFDPHCLGRLQDTLRDEPGVEEVNEGSKIAAAAR